MITPPSSPLIPITICLARRIRLPLIWVHWRIQIVLLPTDPPLTLCAPATLPFVPPPTFTHPPTGRFPGAPAGLRRHHRQQPGRRLRCRPLLPRLHRHPGLQPPPAGRCRAAPAPRTARAGVVRGRWRLRRPLPGGPCAGPQREPCVAGASPVAAAAQGRGPGSLLGGAGQRRGLQLRKGARCAY